MLHRFNFLGKLMKLACVLVAGALVASCQTNTPKITTDTATQQQALSSLNVFSVSGGLGVWTDKESISTRITWQQIMDDFNLAIKLPAGLNTVNVSRTAGLATIRNGSAEPVSGSSAGVLMQQALGLGIAVPIDQMALWIKGVPGSSAEAIKFDSEGRLASMEYTDEQRTRWRAKILQYTVHENVYVPATILATGGPYTVRLTLKNWSKPDPSELQSKVVQPSASKGRLKVPGR